MATVPSYRTWAAAEVVTAAMLNSNVRDTGQYWVSQRPLARLRQSVAQSLTTASFAPVLYDVEDVDRDGSHSTVSNTDRFTAVTAGWHLCTGGVGFASNATGLRAVRWTVGGSAVVGGGVQQPASAAQVMHMAARPILTFLNVGDILRLEARQDSGGALLTTVGSENASSMDVIWIGS